MWHYFYAHAVYHGVRWFPEGSRWKMNIFVGIVALLLPVPQIYVISLKNSSRHCEQPLLDVSVAGIVMTFVAIAFTFLFIILVPVPRGLKIFFHVTGLADFIIGFITFAYIMEQVDCYVSTPELLWLCEVSAGLSIASAAFIVIMIPFWVINKAKARSVLDPYSRTGVASLRPSLGVVPPSKLKN